MPGIFEEVMFWGVVYSSRNMHELAGATFHKPIHNYM